jgi:hypothetical protein
LEDDQTSQRNHKPGILTIAAIAEGSMSTRGEGKGTPSYKQVVVDRGKGPRGIFFKAPVTGTLESDPGIG